MKQQIEQLLTSGLSIQGRNTFAVAMLCPLGGGEACWGACRLARRKPAAGIPMNQLEHKETPLGSCQTLGCCLGYKTNLLGGCCRGIDETWQVTEHQWEPRVPPDPPAGRREESILNRGRDSLFFSGVPLLPSTDNVWHYVNRQKCLECLASV